jgi:hypothetical protein
MSCDGGSTCPAGRGFPTRIEHRHLTTVFQAAETGVLPFGPTAGDAED